MKTTKGKVNLNLVLSLNFLISRYNIYLSGLSSNRIKPKIIKNNHPNKIYKKTIAYLFLFP
jgi:hypothetical protein